MSRLTTRFLVLSVAIATLSITTTYGQIADTFHFTLGPKTPNHPYYGLGSEMGYSVDGVEGATIVMVRDSLYAFQIEGLSLLRLPIIFTTADSHPDTDYYGIDAGEDFSKHFLYHRAQKKDKIPDTLFYGNSNVSYAGGLVLIVDSIPSSVSDRARIRFSRSIVSVFPNPVASSAIMSIEADRPSELIIDIYDASGRLVKSIDHEAYNRGTINVPFDREGLPSGVYHCRVRLDESSPSSIGTGSFIVN